jgi:hypothetical protein
MDQNIEIQAYSHKIPHNLNTQFQALVHRQQHQATIISKHIPALEVVGMAFGTANSAAPPVGERWPTDDSK